MSGKRNPYTTIRDWAEGALTVLALLLVAAIAIGLPIAAVHEYGWHILWQLPLTFGVVIAVFYGIAWVCSKIAKAWGKAERDWDAKETR